MTDGVTALDTARPQPTAELTADAEELRSTDPLWEFLGVTRKLGTGTDRYNLRSSIEDIYEGTVLIFEVADVTKTILVMTNQHGHGN